MSDMAI